MVVEEGAEVIYRDTLLLHGVAVADSDSVVAQGVIIHGDTIGRSNGILTAVAAAYGIFLVILKHEIVLECVHDFACLFG